ncbi:MAG TPA: hypothetical protein VJC04_00840 [Candidatus Paceibacterota bacterium]
MKGDFSFMCWPYHWLLLDKNETANNIEKGERLAVFFGNDFFGTKEIDYDKFIKRTNDCLLYVRRNCRGCKLIYRPHPEERKEIKLLDLASFIIQRDGQTAEEFVLKNRVKIKYAFSFCSTSSIASLNLGINSYIFYRCFSDIFDGVNKIYVDNYLKDLPESFFIKNFNAPLLPNKIEVKKDTPTEDSFRKILVEHTGPVWFIVQENRYLLVIESLAKLIRVMFPERKINLILSRHHRWTGEKLSELKTKFDEVLSFSRIFYSLKPARLIAAFCIARKIRNIDIGRESVLVGLAHHDFIENCFMSYNKRNFKIAILPESVWRLNFKTETLGFDTKKFIFNKAGFFYNYFFEPMLGLAKTRFVHHEKGSNGYFIRLQKPIEEIYDQVYLLK